MAVPSGVAASRAEMELWQERRGKILRAHFLRRFSVGFGASMFLSIHTLKDYWFSGSLGRHMMWAGVRGATIGAVIGLAYALLSWPRARRKMFSDMVVEERMRNDILRGKLDPSD
jgi:hypothetical protein